MWILLPNAFSSTAFYSKMHCKVVEHADEWWLATLLAWYVALFCIKYNIKSRSNTLDVIMKSCPFTLIWDLLTLLLKLIFF